jgi:DcuC family C4-dicarboxylate transporter
LALAEVAVAVFREERYMAGLVLAAVVTAWLIYMIARRYKPQAILLIAGLSLMLGAAILKTGPILGAKETTGLIWFDPFEVVKNLMSTRTAGLGMMLMAVGGFARYMEHVGASKALFALVASPLRWIRSPYVLLVIAFFITQILVLFIPSHAGLGLLLMVTMYPILIRKGVSRLSALSVIGCCQFIDHGPGSGNEILAAATAKLHPATYFVKYQLPITIPIIVAVAATHFVVQRWWDKRENQAAEDLQAGPVKEETDRPPLIYAILPVVPLLLILGFSPLFKSRITMDVITAMIISALISLGFEYVRLRDAQAVLGSLQLFFDGMGKTFAVVVSLIVCGEVFANGLIKIGAVDRLIAAAQSAGFGLRSMIIAGSLIIAGSAFLMGSGNAAFFSFAALGPKIAEHLGVPTVTLLLPMQIMTSFGRTVSPITAAIVAIAGVAGVSPFQVVKRTAIPMAVAGVVNIVVDFMVFAR